MVAMGLMTHERRSEWVMQAQVDCLAVGREYGVWEEELRSNGSVEKVAEWRETVESCDPG
jgi:hypothetical protein